MPGNAAVESPPRDAAYASNCRIFPRLRAAGADFFWRDIATAKQSMG
jgi:hypothetical protein